MLPKIIIWCERSTLLDFLVKPVGFNMAQVCKMLVQRCIAPLSLHLSLKTAWPYQLVIGNGE